MQRIEQEEYITLQRGQRIGLVETDTIAAMEWTWERKTNVHHELVVLYRNVPRYRGQDIHVSLRSGCVVYPTNEESTRDNENRHAGSLNEGGTTKAFRFSSLCG